MVDLYRPTHAVVHIDRLRFNAKQILSKLATGVEAMAIVKADAYGHGAVLVARALESTGIKRLGVATLEEGLELRRQGLRAEIHVLDGLMGPVPDYFSNRLYPVVHSLKELETLKAHLSEDGREMCASLKFDTGMGRLGFFASQVDEVMAILKRTPALRIVAVLSHLARADEEEPEFTQRQFTLFRKLRDILVERGIKNARYSIANSAAILDGQMADLDWVRPGIALYGAYPHPRFGPKLDLKPVLELKSQVIALKKFSPGSTLGYGATFETTRESVVAVLPIGYADGYPRLLSNRAHVLLRGHKAAVVGRISMDLTLVDVTDIPGAAIGDEVTLIGEDGGACIRVEEVAAWADTISYEILCGLTARVPRIYKGL